MIKEEEEMDSRKRRRQEGGMPVIALQREHHRRQQDEEEEDDRGSDHEEAITEDDDDDEDYVDEDEQRQQQHELLVNQSGTRIITTNNSNNNSGNGVNNQLLNGNVKIVKVVPLPHARSEVWSYFGFIADDDGEIQDRKKAICKICATTLSYSGNTTNMFTHLKAMHPEATPQKLQPTNKFPRTGRKAPSKRKFLEAIANSGHLAIQYGPAAGSSSYNGSSASSSQANPSNSYIIRVHSTSNGTEQVFEETLSVSPDISATSSVTSASSINHHHANAAPASSSTTVVTSPSVICVNKNILTSGSASGSRAVIVSDPADTGSVFTNQQQQYHNQSNHVNTNHHHQEAHVCSTDEITNAVVDMIVKDCRPICLVEGKGFQALLKLIAPSYQIPDHQRLRSLVKSKYDDRRRELILRGMQTGEDEA